MNFAVVPKHMFAVSEKVSDMIFSPDRPPQVELNGKLQAVAVPGLDMLTPAHTAGIAKLIIGNHHKSF
jgi:twitching motility protein PilT